jgi:hypothetical protein
MGWKWLPKSHHVQDQALKEQPLRGSCFKDVDSLKERKLETDTAAKGPRL